MSHSDENFRRGGIVWCFINFRVAKKLDKKGGGVSRFSVENFWSHSAENFRRGESFSVSINSVIEKFYASEGYVTIFDFLSIFLSPVPKILVGEPFCAVFHRISGSKNFWISSAGGVSRFSVENFLSRSAENFRRGESFSVSLISGIEKFYASEGYVTIFDFLSNFFVSQCQQIW